MNNVNEQETKQKTIQQHSTKLDQFAAFLKLHNSKLLTIIFLLIIVILILIIFLFKSIVTIKKTTNAQTIDSKIVYVKGGKNGDNAIQNAIDIAGENGVVVLNPGEIYAQTNSINILHNGIKIVGNNATLKRGNEETSILTEDCDSTSYQIHVLSVPLSWKKGDDIQLYTDSTYATSNLTGILVISSIDDTIINLESEIGAKVDNRVSTWPKGSIVRKVYAQIQAAENISYTIEDLIIDGNRTNNRGNYYWAVNTAINSYGASKINRCKFIEIPNENMMGVGFTITNCYAKNLNGSFIHESSTDTFSDKSRYYSQISNNLTDSTNLLSASEVTGHSEALITFSSTAGRVNIHNNFFFNGGNSIIGNISNFSKSGYGARDFIFTDNFVSGFSRIINVFFNTGFNKKAGNFIITNNVFRNCGENDFSYIDFSLYDTLSITGNRCWGKTTMINIPAIAKEVQDFSTKSISIIPNEVFSTGKTHPSGDVIFSSVNYREFDSISIPRLMKIRAIGQKNYWGLPRLSIIGVDSWHEDEEEEIGIDANTKLIDTHYDIEVNDLERGIILRSPKGNRFRIRVSDDGTLATKAL